MIELDQDPRFDALFRWAELMHKMEDFRLVSHGRTGERDGGVVWCRFAHYPRGCDRPTQIREYEWREDEDGGEFRLRFRQLVSEATP